MTENPLFTRIPPDTVVLARDGDLVVRLMRDDIAEYELYATWRNTPHVREWWDYDDPPMTTEAAAAECRPMVDGSDATIACIIEVGDVPVGFVQLYPWSAYPEELVECDLRVPDGAWSLDIFIGSEAHIARGVGSRTVRLVAEHAFTQRGATAFAFGVSQGNLRAIRAYEKAGMRAERQYLDIDVKHGERLLSLWMVRYPDAQP